MKKKRVLFLCTHNAARSQMAEAIANELHGDRLEAYSAGSAPEPINTYAIVAMKELGVDISGRSSKKMDEFEGQRFDVAVTLCSSDGEICPFFPDATEHVHHGVENPKGFDDTPQGKLGAMRVIRDDIKAWIESYLL